jgi:hypothetical protein
MVMKNQIDERKNPGKKEQERRDKTKRTRDGGYEAQEGFLGKSGSGIISLNDGSS